ncbi:MAG: PQQ-binding-like beta-propeller repeat protein [Planctomycetia bacterium]|nr:PQQ-binding-like beta-propeller repeat protein [Planctomycetia bacterium]
MKLSASAGLLLGLYFATCCAAAESTAPQVARADAAAADATTREWAQWGGSSQRNNTPVGHHIPITWNVGAFEGNPPRWNPATAQNIKWVAQLGSQSYGNPVVADGKVFVGTNNQGGWLKRYPPSVDLGCLLCFNAADGKFLWQHSSEKLPTGRVHDWPMQGICSTPLVEGKRLWFVTSRGEVRCLDTEGFHDGVNNGPYKLEKSEDKREADVIWVLDMMKQLGVSQHNMAACSVTTVGDLLLVNTGNGVDESHIVIPAPNAPTFIVVDKNTGKVLWTDKSPGLNILHGQWSSPAYAVLGGVPQMIFGGGDGWLYSFKLLDASGHSELLWKFDCNPKESKYILGGRSTRNHIIGTPVIYDGKVYVAVGEDPEHGEGDGHLWCIDPTKRGDVSPQLAYKVGDLTHPIPHRREQAVIAEKGEVARDNPNSAAVWHFSQFDTNGDGKIDHDEKMHRTIGSVAIKDGLLFIADFSGIFHCLDPQTGKAFWSYDMMSQCWGSPLIVDGHVYIGNEDGDVFVFGLSSDRSKAMKKIDGEWKALNATVDKDGNATVPNMGSSVYSTPIVADNVLYITNKSYLFAIAFPKEKSQ